MSDSERDIQTDSSFESMQKICHDASCDFVTQLNKVEDVATRGMFLCNFIAVIEEITRRVEKYCNER